MMIVMVMVVMIFDADN